MTGLDNHYVGPRSFTRAERDRFHGRNREARDLLSLVISERLVLFHAQSGAGKSSLINARLIPDLVDEGFVVLPVGRISGDLPEGIGQVDNIFMFNLLISLDQSRKDPGRFCDKSLSDFLSNLVTTDGDYFYYDEAEEDETDGGGYEEPPHVLIIDQFEEILTTNQEHWEQRANFFRQLDQAMKDDPLLWVVFVLREDFVAPMEPYAPLVSNRMRVRYYMQRMGYDSALEAVKNPAFQGGRPFAEGVAERLVDNLLLIQVNQPGDDRPEFVAGEFIEPVQLQVVCYQLWENLKGQPGNKITTKDLERLARGSDLAQFVNQALGEYYEQAIASVLQEVDAPERILRDWFSTRLITEAQTRGYVYQGEKTTGGLPNSAVQILEDKYIIRSEYKARGAWVELVHDRFIEPIIRSNQEWQLANQVPVNLDAEAWLASGRDPERLYEGEQLKRAVALTKERPEDLTEVGETFLEASQEAARKKAERRQRRIQIAALTLLLAFASLTVWALYNAREAQNQRAAAETQRYRAEEAASMESMQRYLAEEAATREAIQRGLAEDAATQEAMQRATAVAAQGEAENQRATAQANEKTARKNASFATSRELAAKAATFMESQPRLAVLLGVEAYREAGTVEAKSVLLTSLERSLAQTFRPFGRPIPVQNTDINNVALSPDGQYLAWASNDGSVVIYDYRTAQFSRIRDHLQRVNSVTFSPDGKRLATGGNDHRVYVYAKDPDSGKYSHQPIATLNNFNVVQSLAFNPDGTRLAAAVGIQITIWDVDRELILNKLRVFHNNDVYSVAWSPDGSKIVSGAADRRVIIWNPDNAEPIQNHRLHSDVVFSVAWSPDSQLLASGSRDGSFMIWDSTRVTLLRDPVKAHGNNSVFGVSFSRDGSLLASAGGDRVILLTDVKTFDPVARLEGFFDFGIRSVAFTPALSGPNLLVSGSFDNKVGLHEVVVEQPLSNQEDRGRGTIISLGVRRDGSIWLAGKDQAVIQLWEKGREEAVLPSIAIDAVSAAFDSQGNRLALGDTAGSITITDLRRQSAEPLVIPAASRSVSALAFSPEGATLASLDCADVSGTRCTENRISLWDAATGELLSQIVQPEGLHSDLILSLAFHPQDPVLASGGRDGRIVFWDLDNNQPTGIPLERISGGVSSLAFSPDGVTLASGRTDNTIILWDYRTKQQIGLPLTGSSQGISSLVFSLESDRLYSGNEGGDLQRWDVDFDSWADRACTMAGRNLFQNEWQQFFRDQPYEKTCPEWRDGT